MNGKCTTLVVMSNRRDLLAGCLQLGVIFRKIKTKTYKYVITNRPDSADVFKFVPSFLPISIARLPALINVFVCAEKRFLVEPQSDFLTNQVAGRHVFQLSVEAISKVTSVFVSTQSSRQTGRTTQRTHLMYPVRATKSNRSRFVHPLLMTVSTQVTLLTVV